MALEAPDEAPGRAGFFAGRCFAFDRASRAPARRPTAILWTGSRRAGPARPPRTHPQPRSFPHSDAADFFMKKVLDTDMGPALKGVPGYIKYMKPFIFNMFHIFSHNLTRVDSGDNSPRLKEEWTFRLSTYVDKPVDNFGIALDAGFSAPVQNRWPDSNKLTGWMDCG